MDERAADVKRQERAKAATDAAIAATKSATPRSRRFFHDQEINTPKGRCEFSFLPDPMPMPNAGGAVYIATGAQAIGRDSRVLGD